MNNLASVFDQINPVANNKAVLKENIQKLNESRANINVSGLFGDSKIEGQYLDNAAVESMNSSINYKERQTFG